MRNKINILKKVKRAKLSSHFSGAAAGVRDNNIDVSCN
jgi:hypothetical protein